jgi:hypothetical protein
VTDVKPGQMVTPIPLWNASTRDAKLATRVEVLDVQPSRSQSGVVFFVKTLKGNILSLDAAWFQERQE